MKRTVLVWSLAILAAVVLAAVGGFWYLSNQPLYRPGMVSSGKNLVAPLTPPHQPDGDGVWLVEPSIELAHFDDGRGRNVLVIHGGPGIPFSGPVAGLAALTDTYRFHYYDQRGSGDSSRPVDRFDSSNTWANMQEVDRILGLGAQIADIERIRQILGDEELILIGHSWGGLLAALYAAEFPDRVDGLILIAPANLLVMPQPDIGRDLFGSIRALLPHDRRDGYDEFMEEYFDFGGLFKKSENDLVEMNETFGGYFAEVGGEAAPASKRPGGWMVWAQYLSMGRRHDYTSALTAVEAPVLVIHGADDFAQTEGASRAYVEAFPNAEFVVIDGATHFPFSEQPEAFAGAVSAFLDRLK